MTLVGTNAEGRYAQSLEDFDRAKGKIPSQTQTFSKGWTQFPFGVAPIFADRADGGYVWDVDGNEYIDWPMAIGPILLGHNCPDVSRAIARQLENGIAFSLPNKGELELAARLIDWFPYAERVRFGKNGSDATSGAVRVARAFTGRETILCCGYHGWQDWFVGTTTRSAGVPEAVQQLTIPFPYNDTKVLERLLQEHRDAVAAIIMEPMGLIEPAPGYLESVRNLATQHGAVLIFDECWTGFRIHLQGAYGKFGVAPDLACFGKALGNGVPISVVLGQRDVMEMFDEAFFSFTFGGDMLGIVAAGAVLDVLERKPVLAHVERIGRALLDGIAGLVNHYDLGDHVRTDGYPARHFLTFSGDGQDGLLLKSIFQQEALAAGILAAGYHAPAFAHTSMDVERTLEVYDKTLAIIAKDLNDGSLSRRLKGTQVTPVFRKPLKGHLRALFRDTSNENGPTKKC